MEREILSDGKVKLIAFSEIVNKIFLTSNHFVLIDGFALMMEIIQNKHLNWSANGGVYLNFIYLVERFLNMMLKMKEHLRIVFFEPIEAVLREHDPDLFLAYELMIFHLKTIEQLKNKLHFYKSFNCFQSYIDDIKNDEVNAYIGFDSNDLIISNKELKAKLEKIINILLKSNLTSGITILLIKNMWFSTYGLNASIVRNVQSNKNFNSENTQTIYDETLDSHKNNEEFSGLEISRRSFYFEAVKHLEENHKKFFILHLYLLEFIPISQRRIDSTEKVFKNQFPNIFNSILSFKEKLANILYYFNHKGNELILNSNSTKLISDIFDGRLFYKTIEVLHTNTTFAVDKTVEDILTNKSLFISLMNKELCHTECDYLINSNRNSTTNKIQVSGFYVINNNLFKNYLNNFEFEQTLESNKSEIKCFLNDKNLDEYVEVKKSYSENNYRFYRHLENVSRSFVFSNKRKDLMQALIPKKERPEEKRNMNKMEKILYEKKKNEFKEAEKKDQELFEKTSKYDSKALLCALDMCSTLEMKISILKYYLTSLKNEIESSKPLDDKEREKISINYYEAVESGIRMLKKYKMKNEIDNLMVQFNDQFKNILSALKFGHKCKSFDEKVVQFQMILGEFSLYREFFGKEDKRVDFIPDKWQIDLIDAIDANRSCLVSAPTSSGKTFVSFYVFKKILEDQTQTDSMCIYVAPTKSLINQMMVHVYSRLKNSEPGRGNELFGVLTKDYNFNLDNCRILLTVPERLQIIYFCPSVYSKFYSRIKYIIFDEFQSINDERGKIWEQVILFNHCPFVALSATLANPKDLAKWLNACKFNNSSDNLLSFVKESNDLTDLFQDSIINQRLKPVEFEKLLELLINLVPEAIAVKKLKSIAQKCQKLKQLISKSKDKDLIRDMLIKRLDNQDLLLIDGINPVTDFIYWIYNSCEEKILKEISPLECLQNKFENKLSKVNLRPSETLKLYDGVQNYNSNEISKNMFNGFVEKKIITRNDVKMLEENLKSEIEQSIQNNNINSSEFLLCFKNKFIQTFLKKEDLPHFVEYLKQNDFLPCLVFIFTRSGCERYCKDLLEFLEKQEEHLRATKYKKILDQLMLKQSEKKREKKKEKPEKDMKRDMIEDLGDDDQTNYSMLYNHLDECVIGDTRNYSNGEIDEQLKRAFQDLNDWRCKAIKRGFCYHHAGLDNKKRICVESLFRNNYLKLLFCTSTLALGIHVPCKTVVFLDDSPFLDAETFKQCSGRAGRRGLEKYGNVIFLNIPEIKIKQLITAEQSDVKGNFLISPTFILRSYSLTSSINYSIDHVMNVFNNGLKDYSNQYKDHEQLCKQFYFLYCTEFLYENSLLNQDGSAKGLTDMVKRLHYYESGSFVLNYLLSNNILEAYCAKLDKENTKCLIVTVLSHLFNRIVVENYEKIENKTKSNSYNSKVILNDLPDEILSSIKEYNQRVNILFKKNLKSQNECFDSSLGLQLPLSKFNYNKSEVSFETGSLEEAILDHQSTKTNQIISHFSMLSGLHDDDPNFKIEDSSILIHLKPYFLDYSDLYPAIQLDQTDFYGKKEKLNSYFADFLRHGSYKCILKENKLRDDIAYDKLYEFKKIIRLLSEIESERSSNPVLEAIREINKELEDLFKKTVFA